MRQNLLHLGSPIAARLREDDWSSVLFPDVRVPGRPHGAVEVLFKVATVEGRPQVTALQLLPSVGLAVSADLLRRVPLRQLLDLHVAQAQGSDAFAPFKSAPRRGPQPAPPDLIEAVARCYEDALSQGLPVNETIRRRFSVSEAAASKYVRRAREEGLLGWPQRRGVAGADAPVSPHAKKSTKRSSNATKARRGTKKGSKP